MESEGQRMKVGGLEARGEWFTDEQVGALSNKTITFSFWAWYGRPVGNYPHVNYIPVDGF